MYRCVVLSALWPASICTSRSEPPTFEIVRAAFVTNVRRPEWLEQPCKPAPRYQLMQDAAPWRVGDAARRHEGHRARRWLPLRPHERR